MLIKVAWRNIWRNRGRSLVVITTLALGLWAGTFASAFVNGVMKQKVDSVIELEVSHIQIHLKGYRDEFLITQTIPNAMALADSIRKDPEVKAVAERTLCNMMLNTTHGASGIRVSGIDPVQESAMIGLEKYVKAGEYFTGVKRNPILISKKTAEEFELELKSKIVMTWQDVNGEIASAAFRVAGIFDTGNAMFDRMNTFALRSDIQSLSGLDENVHEIAIRLKENGQEEEFAKKWQAKHADLEILSWLDLSTGMRYMIEVMGMYTVIIVGIILFALLFSIINTMLMAVLERVREIGMLMAVGMNRPKIFFMILLETIFLCLVGTPIGLLAAWASIAFFGIHGINLGDAAYGDFGFSNLVFPALPPADFLKVTFMVVGMAILAAIYPARKALQLNPVEAIRKL